MTDQTKLPAIPSTTDPFLSSVKEIIEVRSGQRGNPLDQFVTMRQLQDAGMVAVSMPNGRASIMPVTAVSPDPSQTVDTTPPPQPTNVSARGGLANIIISWDVPVFSNFSYAELSRASVNDIGQAVKIGTTTAAIYVDNVGSSADDFYWVRFFSTSNIPGPYSAVTEGTTGTDPTYMLTLLTGQIKATHLYTDLNSRINLIDGPATMANSVAYQVQQEATSRANGDDSLSARIDKLTAGGGTTVGNKIFSQAAAPTAEQTGDIWFDTGNNNQVNYWDGAQWVLMRDSGIAANASAISTEQTARANGDTSLTNQINSLTSTVNTNNSNQTAAVNNEASTRASNDSALSGRIDSLTASLSSGGTQVVTATNWNSLNTTVTNQGNSITANANSISSLKSSLSDANGNQTVTASAWSTLNTTVTNQGNSISSNTTSINTLNSTVNGNSSSIQTLQTTQNGLTAQYMVKLDSNGYVSGFGLYNNGSSSSFLVRSDTFAVVPAGAASGQAGVFPFIVSGGSVYMNSAVIANGTIQNAMIGDAAVDNAKIASLDAGKINTGTLSADRIGVNTLTGDKLIANSVDAVVLKAGTITADKGVIGNAAVNTLQLAGQAVTIPVSAYTGGGVGTSLNNWVTIQSCTLNSSGAPVQVLTSCTVYDGTAGRYHNQGNFNMRVVRDGTVIYENDGLELPYSNTYNTDGTYTTYVTPFVFAANVLDTCGTGSHTYYLQIENTFGQPACSNNSITLMETKR